MKGIEKQDRCSVQRDNHSANSFHPNIHLPHQQIHSHAEVSLTFLSFWLQSLVLGRDKETECETLTSTVLLNYTFYVNVIADIFKALENPHTHTKQQLNQNLQPQRKLTF